MAALPGARVFLLTGATGAIGSQIAARIVAEDNIHLVITARASSEERAEALAKSLARKAGKNSSVSVELLDLSKPDVVMAPFARSFAAKYKRLDVLVNNAATVPADRRIVKFEATGAEVELQWCVNVLSYAALMHHFAFLLAKTGKLTQTSSRIVNVASNYAGGLDLRDVSFARRRYDPNTAYRASKQADRMLTWAFAAAAAAKGLPVVANACHPGVVTSTLLTGLGMGRGFDSAEKGAATPAYLALDLDAGAVSGKYWQNCGLKPCPWSCKPAECAKLWEYCSSALRWT